ncbi:MAG: hypothetical protein EHM33_22405 [Chloroflexi bacterium]|nr:MAG: hypothetical protein EHM33_22405 [Chloroflexota bacterium]
MKKMRWVSLVLVLAIVSMSCQLFTSTSNKDGVVPGDLNQVSSELPIYDPEAPLPSPGAAALRALAVLEPGVAELQGDVEAAERAALNAIIADLSAKTGSSIELPFPISQLEGAKVAIPAREFSVPANYKLVGDFDEGISTANDASTITLVASGWNDLFTPDVQAGAGVSGSATETEGAATNTSSIDLGRNADGSTRFGFGSKTEATENGVAAKTEVAASLDGQRCPNAEGQVSFTVKVRLGADSGGSGYTQDLTAFVRAEVGDDAQIASTTIDLTQGTRQAKNGRQVYVETGQTIQYNGNNVAGFESSNLRLIRASQEVTREEVGSLSSSGHDAAFAMARTALLMAQNNWLDGGCVKIEAASPGTVQPGSTTAIPVMVHQRFDGSEVPSKLEAALSGEKSIDPTSLTRTPGTLTYTAPDEKGKSATITLTATSKRGKAKLELTANTGGAAYRVSGESNEVSFSGEICDLEKPFTIEAVFPGGSATTLFTPGNTTSGVTEMSGEGSGCTQSGSGSYTVTLNEEGSGSITWTDSATLTCPLLSNTRTNTFTLPLQPAPDLSCP